MGRKPIANERKHCVLQVRLTYDEMAEVAAIAEKLGLGTSTWVRDVALTEARHGQRKSVKKKMGNSPGQSQAAVRRRQK